MRCNLPSKEQCRVHAGEEDHARPGRTTSTREQDFPRGTVNQNDRGQRYMKKVGYVHGVANPLIKDG